MNYNADYLINFRKCKWEEDEDLERDGILVNAIAEQIVKDSNLFKEVVDHPEKLIELCFYVVNKEQKTVPYFFNEVQNEFLVILNKAISDYSKGLITDISILILKGRQQGFTTFVTAYQLSNTILKKNFIGYTLADITDNAEGIFTLKAKFMYNRLPECLKPTEKYNTKRQMIFEVLNSSWSIDSATDNVGRSKTINFFHGSECAIWKYGISGIQAGLGEALVAGAIKIYESTANGFNDFQEMWESGAHINCFFEWWKTKEYTLQFESLEIEHEFLNNINKRNEWIFSRLKWLKDTKNLEDGQLYWYYKKYDSYIKKYLIKQEYPCTPQEAFISTGNCIFDQENVIRRMEEVKNKKPIKKGFFLYTYKDDAIKNIEWLDDDNGYISIYEDVKEGYPYVLAGDTAGDGSDFFIGQVLDNTNDNQVAILENDRIAEDIYTIQMYCLGLYYNTALIGIETNFSTYPVMKLAELHYPKQYIRKEAPDKYTGKLTKYYGFLTNAKTRNNMFTLLIKNVRDEIDTINDFNTLKEFLTIIYNAERKPEAQQGYHDDHTLALGIAYEISSQQTTEIKIEKASKKMKWTSDMLEDYYNGDSTSKKMMEELYGRPN